MANKPIGAVALVLAPIVADGLRQGAEARVRQLEAENEKLRDEVRTLGRIARCCTRDVLGEPCAWCTTDCAQKVAAE